MRELKNSSLGCVLVGLAALGLSACGGEYEGAGEIQGLEVPASIVDARAKEEANAGAVLARRAQSPPPEKRILFGDLHVHTTFSADAFMMSLPFNAGEGAHPVADACDFARYCSALDFWSINDHAEALSPRRWADTKEAIRQCNAVASDPENPDMVSFLGWEWTQIGDVPENHYGHKNVIVRDTAEDKVPARPIASEGRAQSSMRTRLSFFRQKMLEIGDFPNRQRYRNFFEYQDSIISLERCPTDVPTADLPVDCMETAATPAVLFDKLHQWGGDAMVIPHGAAWGIYTPNGADASKHAKPENQDVDLQRLIEVFSGHGNSEVYRPWRAVGSDDEGSAVCPQPRPDYEPCCWRAGEIIRARCADPSSAACEAVVEDARANYLAAGIGGRLTVPGAELDEWGDCGQCTDCFNPSMNYRPGNSFQFAMAVGDFSEPEKPNYLTAGFIASSDIHRGRPGTGYKEFARRAMTESTGPRDDFWREQVWPQREVAPESLTPEAALEGILPNQILDFERSSSFFYTGGLVAVHSEGRDRDAIWDALNRREVFGTSGERMLLWFDLLNAPDGMAPMGAEVTMSESPQFRVRAQGALQQKPGCPEHALRGLDGERLQALCHGQCYNPSQDRKPLDRIEVVRIRRQASADEAIETLIDDPWKTLNCPGDGFGCVMEFDDPEYPRKGRSTLYYVRAIEKAQPAVNAGGLRCEERREDGSCVKANPCYGDSRTALDDDCLAPNEERAWSSPIFLQHFFPQP
jgi:hypothetical protein